MEIKYNLEHFGWFVKYRREQLGLSKNKLSKLMGITRQYLAEYEKKPDIPKYKTIKKFCKHLKFSVNYSVTLLDQ